MKTKTTLNNSTTILIASLLTITIARGQGVAEARGQGSEYRSIALLTSPNVYVIGGNPRISFGKAVKPQGHAVLQSTHYPKGLGWSTPWRHTYTLTNTTVERITPGRADVSFEIWVQPYLDPKAKAAFGYVKANAPFVSQQGLRPAKRDGSATCVYFGTDGYAVIHLFEKRDGTWLHATRHEFLGRKPEL